jgi:N-methylhydantoinase B/oxoprolinase/acetone carboxylase alpha subunit
MGSYVIQAVSKTVRGFDGKFGPMKSYKVKFQGDDVAVEITQKAETPAPKLGDTLEGTIDTGGSFGPQFKKDYSKNQSSFKNNLRLKLSGLSAKRLIG